MNTQAVRRYLAYRKATPTLPANVAAQWARTNAEEASPLEWHRFGTLTGEGEIDGFDVSVKIDFDTSGGYEIMGEFSDTYEPGAVQNPGWSFSGFNSWGRAYNSHTLRWYIPQPDMGLHELAEYNHKSGMSKSVALDSARETLVSIAKMEADPEVYAIHVTVEFRGVELGSAGLYGIDADPDASLSETREMLISMAEDVISEAVEDARSNLTTVRE
jgi:hypothetical protein